LLEILIHFFFSETEKYPGISASTDSSGKATFTLLKESTESTGTDHDKRTTDTLHTLLVFPYKPLSATTVANPAILRLTPILVPLS